MRLSNSTNFICNPFSLGKIIISSFVLLFFSCKLPQQSTYLRYISNDTLKNILLSQPNQSCIIKNKDVLKIYVSSLSPDFDEKINKVSSSTTNSVDNVSDISGYMVDSNGRINMHFLGDIQVSGLTLLELKQKLDREASSYLKQPIFNVSFLTRNITLLGDVSSPGVVGLAAGTSISIIDLLALRGDTKESALLSDIIVIRDTGNNKIIHHMNLQDSSFFYSEAYYVRPGDIVIVKRDANRIERIERKRDSQVTFSIIVSLVSIFIVLFNTFFR